MKNSAEKKAVQAYKKAQGNYRTGSRIPLKKESDLDHYYYPGINGVLQKIEEKPEQQKKLCSLKKTVAVISTKSENYYPVISAKAAIISEITDLNAIPLMLHYKKVKHLGNVIENISNNFQVILCTDFSPLEKEVTKKTYKGSVPLLFHEEMQATTVISAIINATKMLKKSAKKIRITMEGTGEIAKNILKWLKIEKFNNITLLDERGPIYQKRPNINKDKKELSSILKLKKDQRSREEVLKESDIYLNTGQKEITQSTSKHLPGKAVIISLKANSIEKSKKQTLVSTLPSLANHITDLHITSGIMTAICEGKEFSEKMIQKAIHGLSKIYKSPQSTRLMPGLLEKNLANKIAKEMK